MFQSGQNPLPALKQEGITQAPLNFLNHLFGWEGSELPTALAVSYSSCLSIAWQCSVLVLAFSGVGQLSLACLLAWAQLGCSACSFLQPFWSDETRRCSSHSRWAVIQFFVWVWANWALGLVEFLIWRSTDLCSVGVPDPECALCLVCIWAVPLNLLLGHCRYELGLPDLCAGCYKALFHQLSQSLNESHWLSPEDSPAVSMVWGWVGAPVKWSTMLGMLVVSTVFTFPLEELETQETSPHDAMMTWGGAMWSTCSYFSYLLMQSLLVSVVHGVCFSLTPAMF